MYSKHTLEDSRFASAQGDFHAPSAVVLMVWNALRRRHCGSNLHSMSFCRCFGSLGCLVVFFGACAVFEFWIPFCFANWMLVWKTLLRSLETLVWRCSCGDVLWMHSFDLFCGINPGWFSCSFVDTVSWSHSCLNTLVGHTLGTFVGRRSSLAQGLQRCIGKMCRTCVVCFCVPPLGFDYLWLVGMVEIHQKGFLVLGSGKAGNWREIAATDILASKETWRIPWKIKKSCVGNREAHLQDDATE